jgi:Holliday junction DNA helicase RuvA
MGVYLMYEYIRGLFVGISKDYIIIDNNGIGYKIFTSGNTMLDLPELNGTVQLFLQQIIREDFMGLYGFLTKEELEMFNLLLGINGVGAKASLSLLSISNVNNLKYAILSGDEKTLTRAPGIGKKTAQRIILELKDKLNVEELIGENNEEKGNCINESIVSEALEALKALGYSDKEAEKALSNVDKSESIENIIKKCLAFLMN